MGQQTQNGNASPPMMSLWWRCTVVLVFTVMVACGGNSQQSTVIQSSTDRGVAVPRGLSDTMSKTAGMLSIDIYVDDVKSNALNENLSVLNNLLKENVTFETSVGVHQIYLKYYLTVSGQRVHIATSSTFSITVPPSGLLSLSLAGLVTIIEPLPDDDGNGVSNLSEFDTLLQLTITKSGGGTVTATNIDCGNDCEEGYARGTSVTLSAIPELGSVLVSWAGDCSGVNANTTIIMTSDRNCSVEFATRTTPLPLTPPMVISTVPPNNSLDAPLNSPMTILFSETLDVASVQASDFLINDGVSSPVSPWSVDVRGDTVTLVLSPLLRTNSNYSITVSTTFLDREGEMPTTEYVWSFSTTPGDFKGATLFEPTMVEVPAGSFTMGSPNTEPNRLGDEGPQHTVTFTKPFLIGESEVTFEEYNQYVNATGANFIADGGVRPTVVTWNDAESYAIWLSQQTGKKYRLPTEAEWEYAARAGTTTAYWWGADIGVNNANCFFTSDCGDTFDNVDAPVKSFAANSLGLYDTAGNVLEWVADCYHSDYFGAPRDGSAWITNCTSTDYVQRGGGYWNHRPPSLRSASRFKQPPHVPGIDYGFRLAQDMD